ncbi:transporter substrate-binding domain-containing protein [Pseudomonas sp. AN-1]|uniref:transporter substrate-binding domain-containing protein n=1 Tax=Pseudomonas sp. AN-1 TaxID=3096605 RepID=UPI002A6B830E|nr:transporter substrate-binding domain-containing protein [Pseudomonas sp. AN-1]WPP47039.1 transporter substrate-binding domain-containing protein [Pseudomonas sp. AN-1]
MPELLLPAYLGELRPLREAEPPRQPLPPGVRLTLVVVAAGLILAALLGGNWPSAWWAPHPADLPPGPLLAQAQERGKLLVGVREYQRPALPGAPVQAEPDLVDAALARTLGDYLNLPVELVGLPPAQREVALVEGRVDLLIAGSTTRPALGTHLVLPASARHDEGALLVLRGRPLSAGAPLRGRSVCLAEGSPYHQELTREHGAEAHSYPSAVQAIAAFQAGECAVLAEEASLVAWLLQQPDWRFYRRLPITLRAADGGHVRLPASEPQSRAWLAAALADWRRRGGQDAALAHWIGELSVDVLKLEQGLICH